MHIHVSMHIYIYVYTYMYSKHIVIMYHIVSCCINLLTVLHHAATGELRSHRIVTHRVVSYINNITNNINKTTTHA